MIKTVNIRMTKPYKNYPIVGHRYELTTEQIYELIMVAKAVVTEIKKDGSTILLTHLNYDKDFSSPKHGIPEEVILYGEQYVEEESSEEERIIEDIVIPENIESGTSIDDVIQLPQNAKKRRR